MKWETKSLSARFKHSWGVLKNTSLYQREQNEVINRRQERQKGGKGDSRTG